jgi:hypothetical protein
MLSRQAQDITFLSPSSAGVSFGGQGSSDCKLHEGRTELNGQNGMYQDPGQGSTGWLCQALQHRCLMDHVHCQNDNPQSW